MREATMKEAGREPISKKNSSLPTQHQIKAEQDKWHAVELSRIEKQAALERNLILLEKFEDKSRAEAGGQGRAHKASRAGGDAGFQIADVERRGDDRVGERLVEHHRVAGEIIDAQEHDRPGRVGRPADDLRVEEIADANEERRAHGGGGEPVGDLEEADVAIFSDIEPDRDQHAREASVARQPAVPDRRNLPGVREVVLRLVEKKIAEPGAAGPAGKNMGEKMRKVRLGTLFAPVDS